MSITARQAAAAKYKPSAVNLLLVAEAPPSAVDRYFYFENVAEHDWLFRYVWEGLTGHKPDRTRKGEHLATLKGSGIFLIDLHEQPVTNPTQTDHRSQASGLARRCQELRPRHIVLIKASIYDAAFEVLRADNLPVIDQRIPFPSSGQQKKFLESFRVALAVAGFTSPGSL